MMLRNNVTSIRVLSNYEGVGHHHGPGNSMWKICLCLSSYYTNHKWFGILNPNGLIY